MTGQVAFTTYQHDNYRSGANTQETTLTPTNVNVNQFGRLQVLPVQGYVYAQPLYVPNLNIAGTSHNVVFVATEHDQVYAFDANSGVQLWHTNLLVTVGPLIVVEPVSSTDVSCGDLIPEIGITGTPVIDTTLNEMFLVTKTKQRDVLTGVTTFRQTLYALDIRTGRLRNPPHDISARVHGTGQGSQNGFLTFDPLLEGQRYALMLQAGQVFIGWASHCDNGAYHGWLMGFNESSLFSTGVFVDTPNGAEGGFWGSGMAADSSGAIYAASGNGDFSANVGGIDYGDSVMRFTPTGASINLVDYFTPWDESMLDIDDIDVGSGGILLLPDQPGSHYPHLLVQVGKEGTIDLVNRDDMGHFHAGNDDQIVQTLPFVIGGVWGAPAFWNDNAYFGGQYDHLKAFAYDAQTQLLSTGPTSESTETFDFPGSTPSVSSNGTTNGIVWIVENDNFGAGNAVLRAYNANNLGTEYYNSNQSPVRDAPGIAVKFTVPTVADGHVFVGTENQVAVYGLLP
jgi:outer membrane protein assembly factor BamB